MEENKELEKFITELEVEMSAQFQARAVNDSVMESFSFDEVKQVTPEYHEDTRNITWKVEVAFIHKNPYEEDNVIVFHDDFENLNVADNAAHLVAIGEMVYDELNFEENDINETEIKEAIYGKM